MRCELLQNRFHIEHGFLSHAKVAFLKVIAKFILPFFLYCP